MSFIPNALSQRDPRWSDESLGFDDNVTIGTDGSALVCLTMLVNGYGFIETPSSMNRKLKAMGSGIGFHGSLIVWPGLPRAFPKMIFDRVVVCRDRPAPLEEINASLEAGQALVVEIDQSPEPGLQNHWVVLYARQENDYLMLDPWPQPPDEETVCLMERYGSDLPADELITTVVWYETGDLPTSAHTARKYLQEDQVIDDVPNFAQMPASIPEAAPSSALASDLPSASEPEPLPTPSALPVTSQMPAEPAAVPTVPGGPTVLVSKSIGTVGLRLRDQPNLNSNTLAVLFSGMELTCLETAEQALPKIGQVNQWLNVRDENGTPGYVAAWFVEIKGKPAADAAPQPLRVLVSSQASSGLRLRDRPSENGSVLEILKPGTLLTVLEPAASARPKIGVVNQWLNVRLPGGMTGYVAAWYVTV